MKPDFDLTLYAVTDPTARHGVDQTVARAVAGGATLVQLRDKAAGAAEFVALGRALVARLAPFGVPLIVNDRVELVAQIGAAGAHIGQSDGNIAAARATLGPGAILGLSIETPEQLAQVPWAAVDYIGAGPYRATATKPDHAAPIGAAGLAAIAAAAPVPTVAIGGLSAADAWAVRHAGAAGMAVVSAVMAAADPEAAARRIRTAWSAT